MSQPPPPPPPPPPPLPPPPDTPPPEMTFKPKGTVPPPPHASRVSHTRPGGHSDPHPEPTKPVRRHSRPTPRRAHSDSPSTPLSSPPQRASHGPTTPNTPQGALRNEHKSRLEVNTIIKSQSGLEYRLSHLTGEGTFSLIYEAVDLKSNQKVAIKVCKESIDRADLLLREARILEALKDKRFVCRLLAHVESAASSVKRPFLVLELLGHSVSYHRRQAEARRLPIKMAALYVRHMLRGLQDVHEGGFVHRDVKPSNFLTPFGEVAKDDHTCKVVDFGLARKHLDASGRPVSARARCDFRGSSVYASIHTHDHQELGRRDDLWSLVFVLLDLVLQGGVPWRGIRDKDRVKSLKKHYFGRDRCPETLPRQLRALVRYLHSLKYEDRPDYDLVCRHLSDLADRFDEGEYASFVLPPHKKGSTPRSHDKREAKQGMNSATPKQSPRPGLRSPASTSLEASDPLQLQRARSCPTTVHDGRAVPPSNLPPRAHTPQNQPKLHSGEVTTALGRSLTAHRAQPKNVQRLGAQHSSTQLAMSPQIGHRAHSLPVPVLAKHEWMLPPVTKRPVRVECPRRLEHSMCPGTIKDLVCSARSCTYGHPPGKRSFDPNPIYGVEEICAPYVLGRCTRTPCPCYHWSVQEEGLFSLTGILPSVPNGWAGVHGLELDFDQLCAGRLNRQVRQALVALTAPRGSAPKVPKSVFDRPCVQAMLKCSVSAALSALRDLYLNTESVLRGPAPSQRVMQMFRAAASMFDAAVASYTQLRMILPHYTCSGPLPSSRALKSPGDSQHRPTPTKPSPDSKANTGQTQPKPEAKKRVVIPRKPNAPQVSSVSLASHPPPSRSPATQTHLSAHTLKSTISKSTTAPSPQQPRTSVPKKPQSPPQKPSPKQLPQPAKQSWAVLGRSSTKPVSSLSSKERKSKAEAEMQSANSNALHKRRKKAGTGGVKRKRGRVLDSSSEGDEEDAEDAEDASSDSSSDSDEVLLFTPPPSRRRKTPIKSSRTAAKKAASKLQSLEREGKAAEALIKRTETLSDQESATTSSDTETDAGSDSDTSTDAKKSKKKKQASNGKPARWAAVFRQCASQAPSTPTPFSLPSTYKKAMKLALEQTMSDDDAPIAHQQAAKQGTSADNNPQSNSDDTTRLKKLLSGRKASAKKKVLKRPANPPNKQRRATTPKPPGAKRRKTSGKGTQTKKTAQKAKSSKRQATPRQSRLQ